jgi:hypothetical protein
MPWKEAWLIPRSLHPNKNANMSKIELKTIKYFMMNLLMIVSGFLISVHIIKDKQCGFAFTLYLLTSCQKNDMLKNGSKDRKGLDRFGWLHECE